jgi:hypothetical protein
MCFALAAMLQPPSSSLVLCHPNPDAASLVIVNKIPACSKARLTDPRLTVSAWE